MSKELEALECMEMLKCGCFYDGERGEYVEDTQEYSIINQALLELKTIKEEKPSEALEGLENIEADLTGLPKHVTEYDDGFDNYLEDIWDRVDTIKATLLKAQEQEKELKQIKEADPSEALEGFRGFKNGMITDNTICITKSYFDNKFPIIEQALLKAEEMEKELVSLYQYKEFAKLMFDIFDFEYNGETEILKLTSGHIDNLFSMKKEVAETILKTGELLESENGVEQE